MRLLIVKTSSMGDVVHTLPAVSDLHRLHPGLEVDWLVEPAFAGIAELHPGVSQVHRLAWRKWRRQLGQRQTWQAMGALIQTLQRRQFDLVIDCQGLLKSAFWARQSGAPVAGYDRSSIREPLASLLYSQRHTVAREAQAVWRSRRLVRLALQAHLASRQQAGPVSSQGPFSGRLDDALGDEPPDFGLQSLQGYRHEALDSQSYAVLIPNASRPEKLWPEPDWQAVGQAFLHRGWKPVVLWGSPAEETMAHRIAQGCQGWVPPFLTVGDAARLLSGARAVVGLDTGFSHVAAALGRPVVGIYCDHEPALAGLTGPGPVESLGGKGQRPSRQAVLQALDRVAPEPQNSSIRCTG